MAGRKVFTSGEILTAADVNSFLMDQSVMVFADSSARSSAIPSPTEGMVTYVEDANRVEVYDGASFGPIGGILQVARATTSVDFTTTSTSYVDSNISISVTPKSASSNLILFWDASFGVFRSDTVTPQISGAARLVDSSDVALAGSEALMYMRFNSGAPRQFIFPKQIVGFVASGSTAARTYKGQVELGSGDRIEVFNNTYQLGQLFAIEVAN